jgi:hypothetical protein
VVRNLLVRSQWSSKTTKGGSLPGSGKAEIEKTESRNGTASEEKPQIRKTDLASAFQHFV